MSVLQEKGRSLRMCAMRNVGESIICVSGVYCLSEQAHDVISSQQPFPPQVISKVFLHQTRHCFQIYIVPGMIFFYLIFDCM
jgi:hypothetical protein